MLATGTSFINANTNEDELIINNKQTVEVAEDFGCRSQCNADSRAGALAFASDLEDRSTTGELFKLWGNFYAACVSAKC